MLPLPSVPDFDGYYGHPYNYAYNGYPSNFGYNGYAAPQTYASYAGAGAALSISAGPRGFNYGFSSAHYPFAGRHFY